MLKRAAAILLVIAAMSVCVSAAPQEPAPPSEQAAHFASRARRLHEKALTDHQIAIQAAENAFASHAESARKLIDELRESDADAIAQAHAGWSQSLEKCQRVLDQLAAIREAVAEADRQAVKAGSYQTMAASEDLSSRKRKKAVKEAEDAFEEAADSLSEVERLTSALKKEWLMPDFEAGSSTDTEGDGRPEAKALPERR